MYSEEDLDVMKRFDSYIRKCIKNLSINYDKREKNKWYSNIILVNNEEDFNIKDELAEFENSILAQEKIFVVKDIHIKVKGEKLINALEQLSEEQRNILLLYYFEYETDLKIAQQLNSIQRTINNRRKAALNLLKNILGSYSE